MDFRTCPACNASVLEEDAEDCPFCGASMSGKPKPAAAKVSPKKAQKAKAPAQSKGADKPKPQSTPSAKKQRSAAPAGTDDREEDPFEVDTSAMRRAIKLSPRPTKSRTLEVVCPMCETTGYLKPADAGKDVQCANPECMVPVFKSPRPVVEEVVEEEPRQNKMLVLATAAVVVIGAGVGTWWFVLREPKQQEVIDSGPVKRVISEEELARLTPGANERIRQEEAPPATPEEIHKKSLEQIVVFARDRDKNRNSDYGTQLAAEALADAGKLSEARRQIDRLPASTRTTAYFRIQPLVEVVWQQIRQGDIDNANATASTALECAARMPTSIRKSHDAAISLGAALVALDRVDDVTSHLQRYQDYGQRGQVSVLYRAAIDSRTYDLNFESNCPYHVEIPEPMRLGIVETLVARGEDEKALKFASSAASVASRDACRAAWVGRKVLMDPSQAVAIATRLIQDNEIGAAGQCRVWAAVAFHLSAHQKTGQAESALKQALAAREQIESRPAASLPGVKELYESDGQPFAGLPDPSPARSAVLADSDVAHLQLAQGQLEQAWQSLLRAMESARAMAPSPVAAQALYDSVQNQESATRFRLNDVLQLKNDDARMRSAYFRYRKQVGKLHEQANARFALQVGILRAAVERGLLDQVWDFVVQQSQAADDNSKEPFLESSLPSLIIAMAKSGNHQALNDKIAALSTEHRLPVDPVDRLWADGHQRLLTDKLYEVSEMIKASYRSSVSKDQPDQLDRIVFQLIGQVQEQRSVGETFEFIGNLYDPVMKEDAFLLLAAHSVQTDSAADLWKLTSESRDLGALERVALFRGFVAGLQKVRVTPVAPRESAAE